MSKSPPILQRFDPAGERRRVGRVFLVGAGPGDPELLTLRAARLLAQADAVVYDHLVGSGILELVRKGAELVYAGKEKCRHTLPQDEINALIVRLARQGKQVVRLKGGDPFIFGRGGEEAETLAEEGIDFEIVPGITAASGVSCYAGIPLTHRDYAQSCVFATGHLKDDSLNLDWDNLARPRQTVVIYMGLGALPEISRQLIAHGRMPDVPAAVVEQGTTHSQRVVTGTLASIPERVAEQALKSPCLIIIGEVVALQQKLQWFDAGAQEAPKRAVSA
ncbi:MAG TPA: uroporphyrinogen-III C-methyltransferase [Noviherbaspirillum sp.]|uniref:uroporphyrinogen-III C-methyltransferase n=1 Tax=Noviherbaspirillum sp. TaxID=1926288 RepID=UPI002B458D21|nr:uroporphyrinogen-III C-methyltransferase [Noviherbaspirillum sp.]HJV84291.1 uroporphyrinogen-III C-methyltransferase [Noviherbaspirillum sp.]